MATWFISDLHLSPARPDIAHLFFDFLRDSARAADQLFILGDLFDAWIGDDDTSSFAAQVQQELRRFTDHGIPTYFIAGNRDFLIGRRFANATGIELLDDPTVIDLYGTPTLLLHGDLLCTDDHSYQRFRRWIRKPWLTRSLLRLPLSLRMRIANKLRASSKTQGPLSEAELAIMDANPDAVIHDFMKFDVEQMIHGHTHRPAVHQHDLPDGRQATRIVLGDWYTQGSMLKVTAQGYQLIQQPLPEADHCEI
ncbi:UDP-2,3-diacylglucosamine diphosphatase [Pseudidiomarina terrestris]|uniref:UDP-2,3-diacylglucosamine hydrolase n=1 Tax=Pseudidiomarina terrestris TaxID=2820060 RepID=A0AAW7R1Q0_9GAMM|nr:MULTISPECIES: UDP-2,3-diacylglucosamine diphosphatase [unclassified Pseudidiomarina]MDN7124681.1 UDP-2,3-diacylglucosamine diphosphatase [Pseudidiomarina sp. 1APP75-32.1]MDN7126771.1 UDP-2,3-diacylglucosamine diphosphatase [Pseudidiomarina sp. 1APR75-33.1]MDN7129028.1 UDP-2,3-diacylglucosamine diphosphatase [Pseudidiomarina sp. 1APR75-15]MDN7134709.1 UDP-2,3-diacylglucosamine diphosphatase [Pseudidiomarina sp. 1ASP75-5]MDN7136622.1 UDP-2,3-diacylglucosamine diphosphatase [Pseudidiomarina sp